MIPTQDDVASLSRMARVALAARCARRVFPMFTAWELVNPAEIEMARHAITLAETVASQWPDVPREIDTRETRLAQRALVLGLEAKHRIRETSDRSPVLAIWSAAHAGLAALDAIEGGDEAAVYSAYCAIYFAWVALETPRLSDTVGCPLGKRALAGDFEYARRELPAGESGHGRAIPRDAFGVLWPERTPSWADLGHEGAAIPAGTGTRVGGGSSRRETLSGPTSTSRRVRSYLPRAARSRSIADFSTSTSRFDCCASANSTAVSP